MRYAAVPLLLFAIMFALLFSFDNKKNFESSGCIGDVKYSVLPPDQFMRMNPGWVLMDGGTSKITDSIFKKSLLHLDYSFQTLPDGRGVFIRGMNLGRTIDSGDASGNASVGRFQPDEFKHHDHDVSFLQQTGDIVGFQNTGGTADRKQRITWAERIPYGNIATDITILPNGGVETRPRNITLYIYIKVN